MKTKIKLLLGLILTLFITLSTTCNAEEVPILKWEDYTTSENNNTLNIFNQLFNVNNDILIIHNPNKNGDNYITLYDTSGKKKWEYKQENMANNPFLIKNEYLAITNYITSSHVDERYVALIDLKTGKLSKKIDVSNIVEDLQSKANDGYTDTIYIGYCNDKITFIFYDRNTNKYYFYALDLDGNIEVQETESITLDDHITINIDNNIYIVDNDKIIELSGETGNIIKTTPINIKLYFYNIAGIKTFKDGILLYGNYNGYMALEYYSLINNKHQFKQFEEEGEINSISLDNKDNLYIVGKYIDDNTLGKAYFSKYTYNDSNFQKVYETFYKSNELNSEEYCFLDSIVFKNNKLAIVGNTLTNGYYAGKDFLVFYDGNKNYKIDKVIKGNGNLDVVESEEEDNEVKYQVKPGFGYKLISLKIVTESGKGIEVSDDYTFIMPNENITITAVFEPIISNPVTSNNIIKILLELVISISVVYLITKSIRKKKFNN